MENVSSLEKQRNPVVSGETKILLAGNSDPSSPIRTTSGHTPFQNSRSRESDFTVPTGIAKLRP
jgi:hypothetical protein